MNRISLLSIIAAAGCIALATGANAQSANFSSTATNPATCSITALPGDLVGTPNTINGSNFPIELTSTATPGKFVTLCNMFESGISIEVASFTKSAPAVQGGSPYTSTYNLSASAPSAYVGNSVLGVDFTDAAPTTGRIRHGISATASELIVSAKVKAAAGKVLGNGTYKIAITATLTP